MSPQFITDALGIQLAYEQQDGANPGIVFIHGFRSDMYGGKAEHLAAYCQKTNRGYLRFDCMGHGESSGNFRDGCIGIWAENLIFMLDQLTTGPQILIGSSMGGWLMLLAALQRPERIHSLIGIAAAPDFTEKLMWAQFPENVCKTIISTGEYLEPSEFGEPLPITKKLIEDGRQHLLLDKPININCPIHLLQGGVDTAVPPSHAELLMQQLPKDSVTYHFIPDGDHRLSRDSDLQKLTDVVEHALNHA